MAAPATTNPYILNPYEGDILPGTTMGGKLYMTCIAEEKDESKHFSLSSVEIHNARTAL